MGVPFKEDVCVAIVASDHRRDHIKHQKGNPRRVPRLEPWLRPFRNENAPSQTTTTTRPRPRPNAPKPPPARARAVVPSRPPRATNTPVRTSRDPTTRHLTRPRPIRCRRAACATQETSLPSWHARTPRDSQVPAQH